MVNYNILKQIDDEICATFSDEEIDNLVDDLKANDDMEWYIVKAAEQLQVSCQDIRDWWRHYGW